jgi:hypothetical protein
MDTFSLYTSLNVFFSPTYELIFKTKFGTQMADEKPMPDARTSFGILVIFLPSLSYLIYVLIFAWKYIKLQQYTRQNFSRWTVKIHQYHLIEMKDKYKPHSYIGFYVPQVVIFYVARYLRVC